MSHQSMTIRYGGRPGGRCTGVRITVDWEDTYCQEYGSERELCGIEATRYGMKKTRKITGKRLEWAIKGAGGEEELLANAAEELCGRDQYRYEQDGGDM